MIKVRLVKFSTGYITAELENGGVIRGLKGYKTIKALEKALAKRNLCLAQELGVAEY